jgi:hypothetical protein
MQGEHALCMSAQQDAQNQDNELTKACMSAARLAQKAAGTCRRA